MNFRKKIGSKLMPKKKTEKQRKQKNSILSEKTNKEKTFYVFISQHFTDI